MDQATRCNDGLTADGWRARGLQAYQQGDAARACACLQQALRIDPLHAPSMGDLAALTLDSGDVAQALHWARRALVLEPLDDAARYTLACALAHDGQGPAAIATMTRLVGSEGLTARNPDLAALASAQLAAWLGQEAPADPGWVVVDPHELPLAQRLDVIVKCLYARRHLDLLPPWLADRAVALYRQHIHLRTGGVEPGDEARKSSLPHYEAAFEALLDDMAVHGFRPEHAVPLSAQDGLPRNGAHRLAAALAVGCHVAVRREEGPGGRWGWDWFRDHGFDADTRDLLVRTWAGLVPQRVVVGLLWSPVEAAWPALESAIDATLPVVAAITLALPRPGFEEMVRDVYSHDVGACMPPQIERKLKLLSTHSPRVRVLFLERPADVPPQRVRQLKDSLRQERAGQVPVDHYTTVHLSESADEAAHLVSLFANRNNLDHLARRGPLGPALARRLDALRATWRDLALSTDDVCAVGGSVLEALGLKQADDLDVTVRSTLREQRFGDGISALGPELEVVTRGYARRFDDAAAVTDDQLIDDPACHFRVRGIRFADPRIVCMRKQHQRREKDVRDLALLGEYLGTS